MPISSVPLGPLIATQAREFAKALAAVAARATKEEEIRIATERQLAFLAREAGIELDGKHEFTVASGRVDSVYDRVIIEYKNPASTGSRIGRDLSATGSAKVIAQIKSRFLDLQSAERQPIASILGIGFDGKRFIFVKHLGGAWKVEQPVDLNFLTAERFLWALFNLGRRGKPFSPQYLAEDFGADAVLAKEAVAGFAQALSGTSNPRAHLLFKQWTTLFGEVSGYDESVPSEKVVALGEHYGVQLKSVSPTQLLFALHTYYAVLMKLLAAEIVAFFHRIPTPLSKMLNADTSTKLQREVIDLEDGSIFRHLGITNFLEGDLFSWYADVWSADVEQAVRSIISKLDEYNPGTLSESPDGSRDLLKKLYQQLFPRSVRHDLGEFYTPDWLADHVLDELKYTGDPSKRLLDPACGSGTFLVLAINRVRAWFEENRESISWSEDELCRRVLFGVVGFDLNPLAVMAARTNYLIAIRDLIGRIDSVELPIYLADSILTPAEYGDLFTGSVKTLRIPCAASAPPYLLVPKEVASDSASVARYTSQIEHALKVELDAAAFLRLCREDGLPIITDRAHVELYEQLLALKRTNKNGIWARIIKNAFAPLFAGRFDYVAGNPPWINWEHLPIEYREATRGVWEAYNLVGPIPGAKRQSSDSSKTDLSILMTYIAADKYLTSAGKLGFVITRSVFQAELGGWHFRKFSLPGGDSMGVLSVHDWDPVKPFQGQAANITATMFFEKGRQTEYPVKWYCHLASKRGGINEDMAWTAVAASIRTLNWRAQPINPKLAQSPWLFGERNAIDALIPILGRSPYAASVREGINTRGANGVFFLEASSAHGKLLVRNRATDGDDRTLATRDQVLEEEYVYPLLKGRDVRRWRGVPSSFVLLPHDPQAPTDAQEFARLPPKTQEYLSYFRQKLTTRKKFRNFDPSGSNWHGLYSVLAATFSPFKVVWREMASGSIAAVCSTANLPTGEGKCVIPDHKLFVIPCQSDEEAQFVCGCFNSSIAAYLIRSYALSTGISTHVLERLPIPRYAATKATHRKIAGLARDCAELSAAGKPTATNEATIDALFASYLGMSDADAQHIRRALDELECIGQESPQE